MKRCSKEVSRLKKDYSRYLSSKEDEKNSWSEVNERSKFSKKKKEKKGWNLLKRESTEEFLEAKYTAINSRKRMKETKRKSWKIPKILDSAFRLNISS